LIITGRGGRVDWEVADFGWANFQNSGNMLAPWESSKFGLVSDAYRWTYTLTSPSATITRYFTLVADPDNSRIIHLLEEWNASSRQWINRSIVWATRTQREGKKYRFTKLYPIETIQDPNNPQAGAIWRAWAVLSNYALQVEFDPASQVHKIVKEEPGVSIVMFNRDYENEPYPCSMGIVYSFTTVQDPNGLLPTNPPPQNNLYKISSINSLNLVVTNNQAGTYDILITGTLLPIFPPDQPQPPIVGVFRLALPNAVFDPTSPPIPPDTPLRLVWCYLAGDWLATAPAQRHTSFVPIDERFFLPTDAKMLATGEYVIALSHPSASEVIMVRENHTMLWALVEMAEPQEKQRTTGFEDIRRYYRLRQPIFIDTLKGGVM
jgi:hypothetical protein